MIEINSFKNALKKMNPLLVLTFLLCSINATSQTEYEQQAQKAIETFFDGFHKGDTAVMKKVIAKKITLQSVMKNKEGIVKLANTPMDEFLKAIHNRPEDQQWKEELISFTVTADAQIATVWTPYNFYLNGNFSHCGVNTFQLYHDGNCWKILSIVDTRKRKGCEAFEKSKG